MTTPAGGIFWRARIFERFTLAFEPQITWEFASHAEAGTGLAFTPTVGMGAAPHSTGSMNVALTPAIGMPGGLNPFGLLLIPTVGMAQTAVNVNGGIALTFTPAIGMPATEQYYPQLGVTFTPVIGMKPANSKFDAVGAGAFNSNATQLSETHVIAADADAVIVFANAWNDNATDPRVNSVTIGGQTATALKANHQYYNDGVSVVENMAAYGLLNPPTGSVQVVVHYSSAAAVSMNSVSYYGVASFGTAVVTSGAGSTPSHTVAATAGKRIAQAFSGDDTNFANYSKNSRWSHGVATVYCPLLIGDCADHTSEVFTCTNTEANWGSIVIPLNPS